MEIDCSSDGITLDFSKLGAQREGAEMKVVKRSGVSIPPASKLKPGYTWETTSSIEMTSPKMKQPMAIDMKSSNKVEGSETVKVEAGEFQALKISVNTDSTMQMPDMKGKDGGGHAMPAMTMHQTMTIWVAKGVGMVKTQTVMDMGGMGGAPGSSPADNTVTTELVRYSK